MNAPLLEVMGLTKRYGPDVIAVRNTSLSLDEGETLAVLGPSGSGKSTLLRLIAGLEVPDQGDVRFAGRSLTGVQPHLRDFGLMFQDMALFPHLNVFENIAFGLRMRRWNEGDIRDRVAKLLALMRIPDFARRRVDTLSGGEQQRVALARSLASRPRLLMLDEPLGSLDRALREELLRETQRILHETGVTTIYVTHDQDEAFAVAERVLVMERGRPVQMGRPSEVYLQPASPFVARFLGHRNLISCRTFQEGDGMLVDSVLGRWRLPGLWDWKESAFSRATLLIPPGAVSLHPVGEGGLEATVEESIFRGGRHHIRLNANDCSLQAEVSITFDSSSFMTGQRVIIAIDEKRVRLLPWSLETKLLEQERVGK